MVSWLPHLVLPLLVGLAFLPVERRRLLLLAPLVWVADADYAIQSIHRAATHSVLIPAALGVALVVLWRRRDPTSQFVEFATRPGAPSNLLIAAYYLSSHLILDLFQGGVVLFWPLNNTNFYLAYQILLDTQNNTFVAGGTAGTSQGAPSLSPVYPWFSTRDMAYIGFLGAFAAAWLAVRYAKRGPMRPVRVERRARLAPEPEAVGSAAATTALGPSGEGDAGAAAATRKE